MKQVQLNGWNIGVTPTMIKSREPDSINGGLKDVAGWRFTFVEVMPTTGDAIIFEFGQEVRDMIVRELTGGIVLHGGDLPQL